MSQIPEMAGEEPLLETYGSRKESPEELFGLVYNELRQVARAYMRRERADHTLQATALVNEAYLRLVQTNRVRWQSRAHFFAVAAQAMRHILVDHSRNKHALKRGGTFDRLENPSDFAANIQDPETLLALDQALTRLARKDPRQAKVVELRYFGGLTEEEIAEVWNLSLRTVKREWSAARAWLFAELTRGHGRRRKD